MNHSRIKASVAALAVAALVGLSACGGGSDGLSTAEEEMLQAELDAAKAAAAEAERKRQAEEAARKQAEEAQKQAELEQAAAEEEARQAELERVAAEARAEEARRQRQEAEEAEREAERQRQAAEQQRRAEEQARQAAEAEAEEARRRQAEAEQAELSARAEKYIEAINDGGTARTGVTIDYERGSTLKINPGGNFQTGTGAPAISGFAPRTYTRQVGSKQTVYLYTNIQAPGTRAFWKIHGLEVAAGSLVDTNNPKPTAAPQFITDPTDSTLATGVRVGGTYDGVSGTFTCVTSSCMGTKTGITLTDLVPLTERVRSLATVADWSFEPGSITGGIRQNEDTEYLYFGIWAEEPSLASQEHDYEYITGGSDALGTDTPALTGTATFKGGAVGKYVTRNQVGQSAKIGTFTAVANFTANFGAATDQGTLEGTITDFRDGSQTLTGWSVHLGGGTAGSPSNAPVALTDGVVTGGIATARIGGVAAEGLWGATLRGTNNPGRAQLAADADADTKYPLARYPQADLAGLVGNFHATSSSTVASANAALAGAFAATPSN